MSDGRSGNPARRGTRGVAERVREEVGETPPASPNIIEALSDPQLLGGAFRDLSSWKSWLVFLRVLNALPMSTEDLAVFTEFTGRSAAPTGPAREGWLIVGRRGGKSRIAATVAVYLACFKDFQSALAPGERGTVMLLAQDRQQARVLLRYVTGMLESSPLLSAMVEEKLKESIALSNGIDIEIHTSNYRATRGYSIVAAIADEISFWRDETTANPDTEVLNAIRPGLATVRDSLLLCISSPYSRRGALWSAFKAHYGKEGSPVLVWRAPTLAMNPTISEQVVADAFEADAVAAASEWSAEFRRDIETFVSIEVVEGCVIPERHQLPPVPAVNYRAFADPSGGSSDSFTLAISHHENGVAVLDVVLERKPPFSPESVVVEFCETLSLYRIGSVSGDRYAGEWPREQFQKRGIAYEPSATPKSDIYRELLPLLNSGKVELLDNRKLVTQLCSLERRTSRAGKDSIDHAPGAHDDVANAVAGALTMARGSSEIGDPMNGLVRTRGPSISRELGGPSWLKPW